MTCTDLRLESAKFEKSDTVMSKKSKINPYTPLGCSSNFTSGSTIVGKTSKSLIAKKEELTTTQESVPTPIPVRNLDEFLQARSKSSNAKEEELTLTKTKVSVTAPIPNLDELLQALNLNLDEAAVRDGPIVLYYGWFFPEDVCYALMEISEAYLRQCFFSVEQFERFLTSACEKGGGKDPLSFYRHPTLSGKKKHKIPDYHVTSKFCGRVPEICSAYWKQVFHLFGTVSPIHISGLFFTPKTCGFRVKLTEEQERIFDERDISESKTVEDQTPSNVLKVEDDTPTEAPVETWKIPGNNGKSKPTGYKPSEYHPKIFVAPQKKNFAPSNSRAHITVGTAPNVRAVQTGEDLKDIVNLESRLTSVFYTDYILENGDTLRQFGRHGDAFILYFSSMFVVDGELRFKE